MRGFLVLVLALALAGCATPPIQPPATSASPGAIKVMCVDDQIRPTGTATNGTCPRAAPSLQTISMHWNSTMGTWAIACAGSPVSQCTPLVAQTPQGEDWTIPDLAGNITGADVTLAWSSSDPATANLGFGIMVMGQCDGCPSTQIDAVTGTSPLHIQKSGLRIPIGTGYVLHAYAWETTGFVHQPPFVVAASKDVAIQGTGGVTLEQTSGERMRVAPRGCAKGAHQRFRPAC